MVSLTDAIRKVQLCLLEGIEDDNLLYAAGTLMSQSDYQDVVIEREIAKTCGYPLCRNNLPLERPRKGRYRISSKEHKVYDLQETYLYCSTNCVVYSRTFSESLPDKRTNLSPAKVNQVLKLFEGINLDSDEDKLGKNGDLGFSNLTIHEKMDVKSGEVSFEEWIGKSSAIEGYTPQKEHIPAPKRSKRIEKGSGSNSKDDKLNKEKRITFNDMDFMSEIIIQDEYTISKSTNSQSSKQSKDGINELVKVEDLKNKISELSLTSNQDEHEIQGEKTSESNETKLKSSLKSTNSKKLTRSITWADDETDGNGSTNNLCEYNEPKDTKKDTKKDSKKASKRAEIITLEDDYSYNRLASAEACAEALIKASEAVESGESDVLEAVSEAGIIVLPPHQEMDDYTLQDSDDDMFDEMLDSDQAPAKWPMKPGSPDFDLFESEDSWFEKPPEGFSLALSPFATMFMSLFQWMTSSSLAYIYGKDESCHEEYLCVNGREYPRKIVLSDGRSSEIKQTLAGCLARALPGLVTDLRLSISVSTLEQGLARLIETMTFLDSLHSFKIKQWEVLVLLFLEALSVSRISTLAPYLSDRRALLSKVIEGAQISAEEYEIMKDLMIPLGRVPGFASQSGA